VQFKWLEDWLALAGTRSFKNGAGYRGPPIPTSQPDALGSDGLAPVCLPWHLADSLPYCLP
jgi:hypothetical protein